MSISMLFPICLYFSTYARGVCKLPPSRPVMLRSRPFSIFAILFAKLNVE